MRARTLTGRVSYAAMVDASGHATALDIIAATHVDFVPAAFEALDKWSFGVAPPGIPPNQPIRGIVDFEPVTTDRQAILRANDITGSDGQPPAHPPEPIVVVDPVFPYDRLLAGESGEAIAEFVVLATGRVGEIQVRTATKPEFGEALRAALASWFFKPALNNGQPVNAQLAKRFNFKGVPKAAKEGGKDVLTEVVVEERLKTIGQAKGLDEKLMPLYRVSPDYPPSLLLTTKESGDATVSMVICRDGRIRLARVLSASAPDFGWAAITAVNQWVFKPPLRGGVPVDVVVQLPVKFASPKH